MKRLTFLLAGFPLLLIGCIESNPVAPKTELDPGTALAAKPDCSVDPSHKSCKDDDDGSGGGGDFHPVSFPATLVGGGANGMVDPGGQTMKSGIRSEMIRGFNPEYAVATNFDDTFAAGVAACVIDHKGEFSLADQQALLAEVTGAEHSRYTIVNIALDGLSAEDVDHKIEMHSNLNGIAITLTQSPYVEKIVAGDAGSGTYRFSGGTLQIRNHTLKKPRFHALDCPNLDAVDVVFDFSGS